jgi:hypothetical protein
MRHAPEGAAGVARGIFTLTLDVKQSKGATKCPRAGGNSADVAKCVGPSPANLGCGEVYLGIRKPSSPMQLRAAQIAEER